ncbi:HTH domain-containing protein [Nannocystis sp. ILAH1]|uniref:HTH domain-containing protein n=1 Tax=Nannocystis sp. ILAH1 TaxID=2996789 RepID=UPI0022713248|nr:HTH domain-containing protein [Nannocystis sp. ILAH1]
MPAPDALLDAARALAGGDPLRALTGVGRDDSARGLTLRGIAYAQLGDLELARTALEQAVGRADDDPLLAARARAALVEVELGSGAPAQAARTARAAADALERLGDARNAAMQRLVLARAEVLLGRLNEARRAVEAVLAGDLGPDLRAVASLVQAEIAVRALHPSDARAALARAREAMARAPHQLLARTVEALGHELARPVASVWRAGATVEADLFAIESLARGHVLLVDACRRLALAGRVTIPLARRPVLFALLLELARAWPAAVGRDLLAARAFAVRRVNASHRARLRVELGRLRKLMDGLAAAPVASEDGYVLASERDVAVLLPPTDDEAARLGLLLGDGAAWSAQALAEHAGVSRRTAQRALQLLVERGVVVRTGKGKDVRYTRPGAPIASRMLLLGLVPGG